MITLGLKRMIKERMGMTLTLKTHRNVSFWRSLDRVKYCLLFNFSSIVQFHSKTWKRTFKTHQIWVNKSTFLYVLYHNMLPSQRSKLEKMLQWVQLTYLWCKIVQREGKMPHHPVTNFREMRHIPSRNSHAYTDFKHQRKYFRNEYSPRKWFP